jgi:hypothetical protein
MPPALSSVDNDDASPTQSKVPEEALMRNEEQKSFSPVPVKTFALKNKEDAPDWLPIVCQSQIKRFDRGVSERFALGFQLI